MSRVLPSTIRACAEADVEHVLVHTGQHYSYELDEIIFRDLELGAPEHHLAIGSRTDGEQIAAISEKPSADIERERPDAVLVQGDTN